MPSITAILNTYNEGHLLKECLLSIRDDVDEIIVTDMESNDGSRQIAEEFGCVVLPIQPQKVVEETLNQKVLLAKSDWILALDPDMRVPKTTWIRIHEIIEAGCAEVIVFHLRSKVFGRWTDYGHASQTFFYRLFKKDAYLHQGTPNVEIHGMLANALREAKKVYVERRYPILHVAYASVADALRQHLRYAEYEASQMSQKPSRVSLFISLYRWCRKLVGDFVVRSAWKGGKEAMVYSVIALIMMVQRDLIRWDLTRKRNPQLSVPGEDAVRTTRDTMP
jgi:glycosyltransferase involved in cell wall biosynthesis